MHGTGDVGASGQHQTTSSLAIARRWLTLGYTPRCEPAAALPQELKRLSNALVAFLPPPRLCHVCPVLASGLFQTSVGAPHWWGPLIGAAPTQCLPRQIHHESSHPLTHLSYFSFLRWCTRALFKTCSSHITTT
uniref:Uncharacterized protein n=1 Tax=Rhipicephalus appendiculatus TaxID=34631 RepID=A0A131YGG5_RHIAP